MICNLDECNNEFNITKSRLKKSRSGLVFCSKTCKDQALRLARDGNNKYSKLIPKHYTNKKECLRKVCNNIANHPNIFCSERCSSEHTKEINIEKWLENPEHGTNQLGTSKFVKNFMLEKSNYKCSECGWDKKNPYTNNYILELDHIDGNHMNSNINNLRILCPNCHAMTPNYKALNKGKNNKSRYKQYREKGWH